MLAYVAQQAVQVYGWLTPSEMITGLALAETTPGPLIMVVQFVAFVGAYHDPGSLNPWVAAVVASLLTTWVTFVPCFVFVFVGAPYVERLRGNHALSAALTGIMAAVVGVIANLAIYFAIHTLFRDVSTVTWGPVDLQVPHLDSLKPLSLAVAAFAALLLFRAKWSVLRTLGACALVGLGGRTHRRARHLTACSRCRTCAMSGWHGESVAPYTREKTSMVDVEERGQPFDVRARSNSPINQKE